MNDELDEVDFEYATTVADRANGLMSRHAVPPTPENFSVWFSYAMGGSPALKKTIDILLANNRSFDSAINHDLYVTYFNPQAQGSLTGDFPDQLRSVLASAQAFLATAISDNRSQIETLGEVSSQVQVTSDPRQIIEKLIGELSNATVRSSALEANLVRASEELDQIRDSLKLAEQHSNTDALTGLANRRSLEAFLRSAQIAAMEAGNPLRSAIRCCGW